METVLLPAPVELACVKGEQAPYEPRRGARRPGPQARLPAAFAPGALLYFCGKNAEYPKPSTTSTCDRTLKSRRPSTSSRGTCTCSASIRVELNPGRAGSNVLLDIPLGLPLAERVRARAPGRGEGGRHHPGHVPLRPFAAASRRRHGIPQTPRYVLWGEGLRDEMCLGIVQVVRG